MLNLKLYKYCIGAMSKNIVDACIDFSNRYEQYLILIPSRRQVEFNRGYANNWKTEEFASYVQKYNNNNNNNRVLLKRDHAGPNQGLENDSGLESLTNDCNHFDLIHIDPWKIARNFEHGCVETSLYLQFCYAKNPTIQYEIGTEESIFSYTPQQLEYLIKYLKNNLTSDQYTQIKFAVIQSGTSLKENYNNSQYNPQRLIDMIKVCESYGILSKEHNGDYLPVELISEKFRCGLNSINIAPEFGQIETKTYLDCIKNTALLEKMYNICLSSGKWKKWVNSDFNINDKEKLINICGHYVLSDLYFINEIKNKVYNKDIDMLIKDNIFKKLKEIYNV